MTRLIKQINFPADLRKFKKTQLKQISDELRDEFSGELIQLYGVDDAKERVVLDPMKIATLEYIKHRIPIDVEPHLDE